MLKIAICDDDATFAKQLGSAVGEAVFARGEYEITYFESGRALLEQVEAGQFFCQLLLLDIHMDAVSGVEAARWLRSRKIDVDIIFVTVSKEHVYECYTYKAFAYLLKPLSMPRLKQELNRYLDEIEEKPGFMNVMIRGCEHRLPLDRIRYFESDVRKIRIHLPDEILEFYGKLDQLEEVLLEQEFVRCHQSYLVNKRYVTAVKRSGMELGKEVIPISRRYWEILKGAENFG